jgi:hypothetical protein
MMRKCLFITSSQTGRKRNAPGGIWTTHDLSNAIGLIRLRRTRCPNTFYTSISDVHSISGTASWQYPIIILRTSEINGRQLHYNIEQGEGPQPVIFIIHGGLDGWLSMFAISGRDSFSRKYRAISYSRRFAYPNKWIGSVTQDIIIQLRIMLKICLSL